MKKKLFFKFLGIIFLYPRYFTSYMHPIIQKKQWNQKENVENHIFQFAQLTFPEELSPAFLPDERYEKQQTDDEKNDQR